jgi:hypothetical protein
MKLRSTGLSSLALFFSMAGYMTPVSENSSDKASAAKIVTAEGEDVICRSIPVTGTRFPQRICKTQAAWDAFDDYTNDNAKEQTDKFQRLNSGCSTQAQGSCS